LPYCTNMKVVTNETELLTMIFTRGFIFPELMLCRCLLYWLIVGNEFQRELGAVMISRWIWANMYLLSSLVYSFTEGGSWRRLSDPSVHLNWCEVGLRYVVNFTVPRKFSRSFCSV
jgi:hypothetical protein